MLRSERSKSIILERACLKLLDRAKKQDFEINAYSKQYEIALYEVCSQLQISAKQVWYIMIGTKKL